MMIAPNATQKPIALHPKKTDRTSPHRQTITLNPTNKKDRTPTPPTVDRTTRAGNRSFICYPEVCHS
jgi:hypothetical protein